MLPITSHLRIVDHRKQDHIELSSGTHCEHDPATGHDAFYANPDWRPIPSHELAALQRQGQKSTSRIVFFDFGHNFVARCRRYITPEVFQANAAVNQRKLALQEIKQDHTHCLEEFCSVQIVQDGPADLVIHRPHQRSTAFNYDTNTFMGLHIDNHQRYPLTERWRSYHLSCVNLGSTYRYFQFVNLTTLDLLDCLYPPGSYDDLSLLTTHSLKSRFLSQYPHYPIFRVRLEPGQGYICNTQDTIHDGATNENDAPDVSFLFSFSPQL